MKITRRIAWTTEAISVLVVLFASSHALLAHPVPRSEFDRDINVEWRTDAVLVVYHLELDAFTLVATVGDPANGFPVDFKKPLTPKVTTDAYIARMKTVLADQLLATIDKQPLKFEVTKAEKVDSSDSMKFRFAFRAKYPLKAGVHRLELEDISFTDKKGKLVMKLDLESPLTVEKISVPPERRTSGEADTEVHLVSATATMPNTGEPESTKPATITPEVTPESAESSSKRIEEMGLWELFKQVQREDNLAILLDSSAGLWVILLLAAAHGVVHSVSPGHGKTMVAAYLVGEQGTTKHALVLGLIVTITHTSTAFIVALLLKFALPTTAAPTVQGLLGIVGGLLITFVGLWLFFKRIRGESDHIHGFGSHRHSHSHSHSHAHGHEHSHGLTPTEFARVSWPRLILLGISGGIIPCWGAILWVLYCVTAGRFGLALWAVLAFSAGLASVLILLGLMVVWSTRLGRHSPARETRWYQQFSRWFPVVGAALVVVIGLWLARMSVAEMMK